MQNEINKQNQINFRENGYPDILVVHFMLTTGYDVKRLKKMYLLRGPKAQNLLQTISRVNRPYKTSSGKVYRYGYIVDFVDIEKEYNSTLDAYIKELEEDMGGEDGNDTYLSEIIIDKENFKKKFDKVVLELKKFIKQDNVEHFVYDMEHYTKDEVYKIKKLLNDIKECSTEFKLSGANEYYDLIDDDRLEKYIKEVNARISFINFQSDPIDALNIMNNEDCINVIYKFAKTKVSSIDLKKSIPQEKDFDKLKKVVEDIQSEVKKNKNKTDIKIQKLDESLRKIFEKLSVSKFDIIEVTDELIKVREEAKHINEENDRSAQLYGGNHAFVDTISDAISETKINRTDIEKLLAIVYENVKDNVSHEVLLIQGKKGFIDSTKELVTKIIFKNGLYKKVKSHYDNILGMLYDNLLNYK